MLPPSRARSAVCVCRVSRAVLRWVQVPEGAFVVSAPLDLDTSDLLLWMAGAGSGDGVTPQRVLYMQQVRTTPPSRSQQTRRAHHRPTKRVSLLSSVPRSQAFVRASLNCLLGMNPLS